MSYKNYKSRKKKNVKERSILFIRLKKNLTFFFQYIYIYLYKYIYISIYISIYNYIYLYIYISIYTVYILKKRMQHSAFFCKRTKLSHILLRSLQKNKTFSAFFYVLCKSTMLSAFSRKMKSRSPVCNTEKQRS